MNLIVRELGCCDYEATWEAMRRFTQARGEDTPDEIWLLEHPSVFTLGLAGRPEHVLEPGDIPLVHSDRGGQVTYHGPGQAVLYVLLDLRRARLGVKSLVGALEESVVQLLRDYGIVGERLAGAPGVYVRERKVAALGLRIRRGCCYHGLALNVDLDPGPFRRINPCGYPGLEVIRTRDLGIVLDTAAAGRAVLRHLAPRLGYTESQLCYSRQGPQGD